MGSNYAQQTYSVDLVFCIDCTGSMGAIIDTVKRNALNFYDDLMAAMAEKNKIVDQVRVRIIAYRDYLADKEKAMQATDFFVLPEQNAQFERCMNSIFASGGGDEPEDGLEALAYAINSNWSNTATKKRQVIVFWTDATTHEIGFGSSSPYYPKGMPRTFAELSEMWGEPQFPSPYIDQQAKRLVIFAPDGEYWTTIHENWNNVIHYRSEAGQGLREVDYKLIIDTIRNTV